MQMMSVFLSFCQTLADQLTDEELAEGRLYPPLSNIREVSVQMAVKVRIRHSTSRFLSVKYILREINS